jgi:hypothetical protein
MTANWTFADRNAAQGERANLRFNGIARKRETPDLTASALEMGNPSALSAKMVCLVSNPSLWTAG